MLLTAKLWNPAKSIKRKQQPKMKKNPLYLLSKYALQDLIMPDECGFVIVCYLQKPTHSKKKVPKA
jgi:hypothetical protein